MSLKAYFSQAREMNGKWLSGLKEVSLRTWPAKLYSNTYLYNVIKAGVQK